MKIAILGARGIPAAYSGYDTLAEGLCLGLQKSGTTQVLVYCRRSYYQERPRTVHGAKLVYLPAPRLKAVESLLHSFLSALHVLGQRVDVIYFLDPANAPFCLMLRLLGKRVVVHTDGLGWKRAKWGPVARRYYKWVEWLCARSASALVTDNPLMADYYRRTYGRSSSYIPYGAGHHAGLDTAILAALGIRPRRYFLVVARLEAENNTDMIIAEYRRTEIDMPLVIVGDAPYDPAYMSRLRSLADRRVVFAGRINDQGQLNALYRDAYLYIHGHEVGGTNPSLLRAMHYGVAPLVLDVAFNTVVIGECGYVFEKRAGHLAGVLDRLAGQAADVRETGERARKRTQDLFTWEAVVRDHEHLFRSLLCPEEANHG